MKAPLLAIAVILPSLLGCATTSRPSPFVPSAELCNTPGRKALSDAIADRGGAVIQHKSGWDNSVDRSTKLAMGPPLSEVIMPEDKFSQQEITEAKLVFPEASIISPPTMADFDADPARYLGIGCTKQPAQWID